MRLDVIPTLSRPLDVGDLPARALHQAPADLPALAGGLVERLLLDDAERSVLWVRQSGVPGAVSVRADDLRDLGDRLLSQL